MPDSFDNFGEILAEGPKPVEKLDLPQTDNCQGCYWPFEKRKENPDDEDKDYYSTILGLDLCRSCTMAVMGGIIQMIAEDDSMWVSHEEVGRMLEDRDG